VPEMDVRSSRWLSIQGRYLLTSRAGTPPTGERLGGTSDPQARLAQEERGALVTSGDYRTGEKAAGTSSLFSGINEMDLPLCGAVVISHNEVSARYLITG